VKDRGVNVTIECTGANSNELDEVYYYFNVAGSAQDGLYVPSQPDTNSSSCPSSGIKYLPKNTTSYPAQNGTYKRSLPRARLGDFDSLTYGNL